MTERGLSRAISPPNWVPDAAAHYLEHTVLGRSIRAIARDRACHPSTILRQVRRFESRRDDPLVDGALKSLAPLQIDTLTETDEDAMTPNITSAVPIGAMNDTLTQSRIDREALQVLRRLCERGAVLAVARDMDTAVVVREDEAGGSVRTAVVEREIAQAMALKDWISTEAPDARIVRYFVTSQGREALRKLTAQEENNANGFRNNGRDNRDEVSAWDLRQDLGGGSRYMVTESPLIGLSRRKDRDGQPFISREQVNVGERLRQDYELSQLRLETVEGWREAADEGYVDLPKAAQEARDRFTQALEELGTGLADVAIMCCCMLEGLEASEKKMGWSSRSGKIVLRIALTRLIRHYEDTSGKFAPLIG